MTSSDSILNRLATIDEAAALVRAGAPLCLAGAAEALEQLPAGNWIAARFPTSWPGRAARSRSTASSSRNFRPTGAWPSRRIPRSKRHRSWRTRPTMAFPGDFPVRLPGARALCPSRPRGRGSVSQAGGRLGGGHRPRRARQAASRDLSRLGPEAARDGFVAAHVTLPDGRLASLSIVNIFESDGGDVLHFPELGTAATHCLVNGERRGLADYLRERGDADGKLPLVGDFSGAAINVSIQSIAPDGTVTFYAPVFPDTDYHMARPVADYAEAFAEQFRAEGRRRRRPLPATASSITCMAARGTRSRPYPGAGDLWRNRLPIAQPDARATAHSLGRRRAAWAGGKLDDAGARASG